MPNMPRKPNFENYHRSMTDELHALKNRIRDIVRHWGTDGEFKELALRAMLRRHVPEFILIGRGFVVTREEVSTQIDVLVVDGRMPTLFKDGDLMIVTPDSVRGIIEVKTRLDGQQNLTEQCIKLARIQKLCKTDALDHFGPWTGLFVYEADSDRHEQLLRAVGAAFHETDTAINCVAYGKDALVRYWKWADVQSGAIETDEKGCFWHSYEIEHLSPAYFIGNLLESFFAEESRASDFAWFPIAGGKDPHRRFRLRQGEADPVEC